MKKTLVLSMVLAFALLVVPTASANSTISENGAGSVNRIYSRYSSSSFVGMTNSNSIYNGVLASTSTGGNRANRNTGGGVVVDTGNATTKVDVANNVGMIAVESLPDCSCTCLTPGNSTISSNGERSRNRIKSIRKCETALHLTNQASIVNEVGVSTDTGGNKANSNTSGGDNSQPVEVLTGTGNTEVGVINNAGSIVVGAGM